MDEEQQEPLKNVYKYQKRITIDLQSNNFLSIQRVSRKFFLCNPIKSENDPDDLDTFVSISRTQEEIRPRVKSNDGGRTPTPQQEISINRPEVVKNESKI